MARRKKVSAEVRDRVRRMKWWHEAKFGMFIHWGLYSLIGRHEWAMENEAIPIEEYEQLAERFKPKPNAPRAWAKLAKQAGMKYMVMTTKHHEGFCLFDSKLTDYCAPKRACGRDLVAEYVEAARAEGLRVGFYYSLMDWHHPDGARCVSDEDARRRFVRYIHGQIRELCSKPYYDIVALCGQVSVSFFDLREFEHFYHPYFHQVTIFSLNLIERHFAHCSPISVLYRSLNYPRNFQPWFLSYSFCLSNSNCFFHGFFFDDRYDSAEKGLIGHQCLD